MNAPHKYGVVRTIAFVLKLFAWVALLGGLLVAVAAVVSTNGAPNAVLQAVRAMGLVIGPLVGIVWFVQFFAFGSVLSLLVDIEENTRELADQPATNAVPVDVA